VNSLDGHSNLGYCERCGIVYALGKLRERKTGEGVGELGSESSKGTMREETYRKNILARNKGQAEPSDFRWKCPDCDMELTAGRESDLGFLKREHIHELHPNRP
jgi:hypothetical protein